MYETEYGPNKALYYKYISDFLRQIKKDWFK